LAWHGRGQAPVAFADYVMVLTGALLWVARGH
jgi:hypothetical protein